MVGRQTADIADTCTLGTLPRQPLFWLSMGYNFGCMIAGNTLFDSRGWVFGVKLSDEDSRFRDSKGRCHGNHYGFLSVVYIGATWRIRLNRACAAAMRPYV